MSAFKLIKKISGQNKLKIKINLIKILKKQLKTKWHNSTFILSMKK